MAVREKKDERERDRRKKRGKEGEKERERGDNLSWIGGATRGSGL